MKTSNKLLIAFAVSLIVIPLLGMIYISSAEYETRTANDNSKKTKLESFSQPTERMTSIALPTAFHAIQLKDAKNLWLSISYVKDEKFGIKIPDEFAAFTSAKVDELGQLQLEFQHTEKTRRDFINIIIYAPTFNAIDITSARNTSLNVNVDSLQVSLKDANNADFSNSQLNKLSVNADHVDNLYINANANYVYVKMNNGELKIDNQKRENLSIIGNEGSKITLEGNDETSAPSSIKNLNVNTTGKSELIVENVAVGTFTGNFSDQTLLHLPAAYINKLNRK